MSRNAVTIQNELEAVTAKLAPLNAEIDAILDKEGRVTAGDKERAQNLMTGIDRLVAEQDALAAELRAAMADQYVRGVGVISGDGATGAPDTTSRTTVESGPFAHERREAFEVIRRSSTVSDEMQERVAALVMADLEDPTAARYAAAASDVDYARAFGKVARDPQNGHREFTTRELAAWQRAGTLKRALDLSASAALLPTHLDPAIVLSDDGTVSPFRQIARVETGTTNVWNGVSSGGVTTEWLAEATEAADGSPSFSSPSVTAYKLASFVPVSFEAWGDTADPGGALRDLFMDETRQAEDVAFVSGNGTTRPRGIVTALDANTNTEVPNVTSNVFAAADVYSLIENLPARFRPRARWGANLSILADVDQMETANGSKQFPDIMSANPTLLRRPVHEFSEMDGVIAAGTADNILVVGDFRHYCIYLRVGTSIELIPNLVSQTNGRPTGQRGVFMWSRTGANSLVDNAFRILQAESN